MGEASNARRPKPSPRTRGRSRVQRQRHLDEVRHGGKRPGAGRPRTSRYVSHLRRPKVTRHEPVHVTLRLRKGLPSLRAQRPYAVVRRVFRQLNRKLGLRVVHHSAQQDHLHLIVEVDSRRALSRGMQGLTIRLAKALNKAFGRRRGSILRDRYHAEVLRTPRQVKNTLAYVLNNLRHHLTQLDAPQHPARNVDSRSSAPWFDGWRCRIRHRATGPPPHPPPRSWLLHTGWRRHGLLDPAHVPGP